MWQVDTPGFNGAIVTAVQSNSCIRSLSLALSPSLSHSFHAGYPSLLLCLTSLFSIPSFLFRQGARSGDLPVLDSGSDKNENSASAISAGARTENSVALSGS